MNFAFEEFYALVRSIDHEHHRKDLNLRYLCALLSELAYYHVPKFELESDGPKRAHLVPSSGFRQIIASGVTTNVIVAMATMDIADAFVIETNGVVVLGLRIDDSIYVALRGTAFLFEWGVNCNARLVHVGDRVTGRYHQGFAVEAVRVMSIVADEISQRARNAKIKFIYLTGHSLGGAVAGVLHDVIMHYTPWSSRAVLFGSPRYCNVEAFLGGHLRPPLSIRRKGDLVPTLPPISLGYSNILDECETDGSVFVDSFEYNNTIGARWLAFLGKRFQPHDMELYRSEVGVSCAASGATLPLIEGRRLVRADLDRT